MRRCVDQLPGPLRSLASTLTRRVALGSSTSSYRATLTRRKPHHGEESWRSGDGRRKAAREVQDAKHGC